MRKYYHHCILHIYKLGHKIKGLFEFGELLTWKTLTETLSLTSEVCFLGSQERK